MVEVNRLLKRRMGSSHSLHLMELGTYLLEQVQSLIPSFILNINKPVTHFPYENWNIFDVLKEQMI